MNEARKPMQGTWTLTAPDGRTWQAESPLGAVAMESRERIPATVRLQRILDAADEPTQREKDMALLLKRMCRRLEPTDNMREAVTDYLRREGLLGSPLREVGINGLTQAETSATASVFGLSAAGEGECFPMLDPNVPEFGSRYPEKGCYRVGCAVHGGPPCAVCGKTYSEHGTFPTRATHPYTADGKCQHVGTLVGSVFVGAPCAGAACKNGCARACGMGGTDAL